MIEQREKMKTRGVKMRTRVSEYTKELCSEVYEKLTGRFPIEILDSESVFDFYYKFYNAMESVVPASYRLRLAIINDGRFKHTYYLKVHFSVNKEYSIECYVKTDSDDEKNRYLISELRTITYVEVPDKYDGKRIEKVILEKRTIIDRIRSPKDVEKFILDIVNEVREIRKKYRQSKATIQN